MRRNSALDVVVLSIAALGFVLGGPWLFRQVRTLPGVQALAARSDQRIVTLEVRGLRDTADELRVRENLVSLTGVSTVQVRIAQGRAYVVCGPSVADSALVSAVDRAAPGLAAAVVAK